MNLLHHQKQPPAEWLCTPAHMPRPHGYKQKLIEYFILHSGQLITLQRELDFAARDVVVVYLVDCAKCDISL